MKQKIQRAFKCLQFVRKFHVLLLNFLNFSQARKRVPHPELFFHDIAIKV